MCDFNENGNRIISDNLWLASDRIRGEGRGGGATVKPNETKPKDFHNKSAACGAYEFNDLITHTYTHTYTHTHMRMHTPWGMLQVARLVDTACVSGEFVKKVQEWLKGNTQVEFHKPTPPSPSHPYPLTPAPVASILPRGASLQCALQKLLTLIERKRERGGDCRTAEELPNAGMWSTFKCN